MCVCVCVCVCVLPQDQKLKIGDYILLRSFGLSSRCVFISGFFTGFFHEAHFAQFICVKRRNSRLSFCPNYTK